MKKLMLTVAMLLSAAAMQASLGSAPAIAQPHPMGHLPYIKPTNRAEMALRDQQAAEAADAAIRAAGGYDVVAARPSIAR